MKVRVKRFLALLMCGCMILSLDACKDDEIAQGTKEVTVTGEDVQFAGDNLDGEDVLTAWSDGVDSSKQNILDYIDMTTDEDSAKYIPVEDRIAAFDMDGTILCEAPDSMDLYIAEYRIRNDLKDDEKINSILDELIAASEMSPTPDNFYTLYGEVTAGAFEGMSEDDVVDYVADFVTNTETSNYEGLNYVDTFYKPMMELISLLQENDFDVYLVSGSVRSIVWGCIQAYNEAYPENAVDINRAHMIGTDVELVPSNNKDDASDYIFQPDDTLLRGDEAGALDVGMEKVYNIYRQTGKVPVFAAGNSSGDTSLLNMAKSSTYESMSLLIWHDDERESVYNTSDEWRAVSEQYDWELVSMQNEFEDLFLK